MGWYGRQSLCRYLTTLKGRYPANVSLSHHPECVCQGTKKVKGHTAIRRLVGGSSKSVITEGYVYDIEGSPGQATPMPTVQRR
jgi:hypothetical protein